LDRAWTQAETARELAKLSRSHVTRQMVSDWERGLTPSLVYQRLLARVYGRTRAQLGFDAEPVALKAPDLEDELSVLADPIGVAHKVDVHLLEDLHVVITRYAEQWGMVAPRSLLPAVWGHLRALKRLLDHNQAPALRKRVYVLTAETAALAGWLSHLLDNRGDAHAHWTFARDVARQAGEGRCSLTPWSLPAFCTPTSAALTTRSVPRVR
jgi:hypothetical protein